MCITLRTGVFYLFFSFSFGDFFISVFADAKREVGGKLVIFLFVFGAGDCGFYLLWSIFMF